MNRKIRKGVAIAFGALTCMVLAGAIFLTAVSYSLERSEAPVASDAAVVLFHDTEVYMRMTEAARLYQEGYVRKIVVNGGRVHPVLKKMKAQGLSREWKWDEEYHSVLEFLGVPLKDVIFIQVEDAFDSKGEARFLGRKLMELGFKELIITTNKYHSRRAGYIWEKLYGDDMRILVVPVRDESFSPFTWWKDARQFKWTIYETGSWLFLFTRELLGAG